MEPKLHYWVHMEQSPSWGANILSTSEEFSRLIWNRSFITEFTETPIDLYVKPYGLGLHVLTLFPWFILLLYFNVFRGLPGK
jgi:hypothetical protein